MNKELIYVVDDEEDINELICVNLKKSGFNTESFFSGKSFMDKIEKSSNPDLIVLDLMLPDYDGIEICRYLRKNTEYASVPIIMVTAKGETIDKVIGLEVGADDYISKPFSPRELVSRVKAVLRRVKGEFIKSSQNNKNQEEIKIKNGLIINFAKYQIAVNGKSIEATATEFKIFKILFEGKGRVFNREELLDKLWGNEKYVIDRTIDVHIRNLRKKLGVYSDVVKNLRGIGYKLEL